MVHVHIARGKQLFEQNRFLRIRANAVLLLPQLEFDNIQPRRADNSEFGLQAFHNAAVQRGVVFHAFFGFFALVKGFGKLPRKFNV